LRELKVCFEHLNTDKTCRAIVLTGSGRTFTTGQFYQSYINSFFYNCTYLGIDVQYLSTIPAGELNEIDDIARKAMHLRRIIQRTQASLRAVDNASSIIHIFIKFIILQF
jgi:hypothetical protein